MSTTPQLEEPVEILAIFLRNDLTQFSSADIIEEYLKLTKVTLGTKRVNSILLALTTSEKLVMQNVASEEASTKSTRYYRLNLKFAQTLLTSITIPLPLTAKPLKDAEEVVQTNGVDKSDKDRLIDEITKLSQNLPDEDD